MLIRIHKRIFEAKIMKSDGSGAEVFDGEHAVAYILGNGGFTSKQFKNGCVTLQKAIYGKSSKLDRSILDRIEFSDTEGKNIGLRYINKQDVSELLGYINSFHITDRGLDWHRFCSPHTRG